MHFLAHQDRMTGVLNKAAFNDVLDAQLRTRTTPTRFLLTFIDLDGFKKVNDQFGHDAGDTVLQLFTNAAEKALRTADRIGRLGGDEFATLMIIDPDEDARIMAQSLHRRFNEILSRSGYSVTCSMGAVSVPAGVEIERIDLLREADRLMYMAKNSGKNAVRVCEVAPTTGAGGYSIRPVLASVGSYFLPETLPDIEAIS
jgi:diguanylate cyclase (GGDEF)-like protein